METFLIVAGCLFVYFGIPALIIRARRKKKKRAEEEKKKAEAAKKTASTTSGVKLSETHKAAVLASCKTEEDRKRMEAHFAAVEGTGKKASSATSTAKKTSAAAGAEGAKTPAKAASRIKTDPAFSAGGSLSEDKPKASPAPAPAKKPVSKPANGEMEVLLTAEKTGSALWVCRHCSVENPGGTGRCCVCGEIKK